MKNAWNRTARCRALVSCHAFCLTIQGARGTQHDPPQAPPLLADIESMAHHTQYIPRDSYQDVVAAAVAAATVVEVDGLATSEVDVRVFLECLPTTSLS